MPDLDAQKNQLSEMEIDVIGEVMNISMGSAATAMSTILDKKVSITTPTTQIMPIEEFELTYLESVVGVLIKYVEGLDGSNVLLLKEEDLKKILQHLLSLDEDAPFEFDEISMSAICEIMNQMMGSASSALASFLGTVVNISPPEILDVNNKSNVKELFLLQEDYVVSIKFKLIIDGLVESEFICAMKPSLVKDIVQMSLGTTEAEEEQSETLSPPNIGNTQPQNQPQPQPQAVMSEPITSKPEKKAEPVQVSPYTYKQLDGISHESLSDEEENNLDLIMSVPIQITVELGRTKKKIKDIAELTLGNVVELERQAGDQVDVLANGKLIARGDVVVVDDNYSVRVTEIIKREGIRKAK